jgi:hypothetical protein
LWVANVFVSRIGGRLMNHAADVERLGLSKKIKAKKKKTRVCHRETYLPDGPFVRGNGHEWYAGSEKSAENWSNHLNRAVFEDRAARSK